MSCPRPRLGAHTAMQYGPGKARKALRTPMDGQNECPFVRRNQNGPTDHSMIGVVLVTHGRLAVEFRSALEHVVGPQKQIETVTIGPDDDVEQRRKDIISAVERV